MSDSQLVVSQIKGEYAAKEPTMIKYLEKVKELLKRLKRCDLELIPREDNHRADALSKLASSSRGNWPRHVNVELVPRRAIDDEEATMQVDYAGTWMDEIVAYLREGASPSNKQRARRLRVKAAMYTLDGDILYRRSFTLPYLRCVSELEAQRLMEEVHEGTGGGHMGGRALTRKILRQGYYWPTMSRDCQDHVRTCRDCQEHGNLIHRPHAELGTDVVPCPFDQWGLDILGPFPPATGQRKFIIVATDYFTKWVEAEALAKITEQNAVNFVWKTIFCRFGVPQALVVDNGKQFDNKAMRDLCSRFSVELKYAAVAHPMTNGQAEITNKTILQGLKKRLGRAKGAWADELPGVLWSYRTTPRATTLESPFRLAFGMEAVAPAETALKTHRVSRYSGDLNEGGLREELDLLEEVRENASLRLADYRRRVAKHYNSKVRPRRFIEGELVLRNARFVQNATRGKLAKNWEGPYVVTKEVYPGTYKLATSEGKLLPRAWNAEHLKKFYQ